MQNKRTLKICWMYHDIMDLYGDKGNIMVLKYRCEKRGIDCQITTCGIQEEIDISEYDIMFLGGGADKEQTLIVEDLLQRKDNIKKAMESNTFIFLICGGYQLFGQYYMTSDKIKMKGLGFFEYYTEAGLKQDRCIGDIAISCDLEGNQYTIVGFENHGGQTYQVNSPFGKVIKGFGNNKEGKWEGFFNGSVLGTYMHGPLLPKNPEIADFVIYKGLQKQNPTIQLHDLVSLDDTIEQHAKNTILKRLQIVE